MGPVRMIKGGVQMMKLRGIESNWEGRGDVLGSHFKAPGWARDVGWDVLFFYRNI